MKTYKKPPKVVKQNIMNVDILQVIWLGIRNINISLLLNKSNIDDSIHEFMNTINDLIKSNTTNKVRKFSSIQHPWISPYFIKCCHDRDGFFSRLVEIILGVPQGSILGPLLFAIYIFDMPYSVKHSVLFQFADDTTLIIAHKNINVLKHLLNDDIKAVKSYCNSNKILINSKKTKAMLFLCGNQTIDHSSLKIYTGDFPIEFVDQFRFLGFLLIPN